MPKKLAILSCASFAVLCLHYFHLENYKNCLLSSPESRYHMTEISEDDCTYLFIYIAQFYLMAGQYLIHYIDQYNTVQYVHKSNPFIPNINSMNPDRVD